MRLPTDCPKHFKVTMLRKIVRPSKNLKNSLACISFHTVHLNQQVTLLDSSVNHNPITWITDDPSDFMTTVPFEPDHYQNTIRVP